MAAPPASIAKTDPKADQLMEEGEKKLTKWAPFTSTEEKIDKAREKFLKAATLYKAAQAFDRAAQAYMRAHDMSMQNKQEMDAAEDMQNAAMAYRKCNDPRGDELLQRVCDIYDKNGKYVQSAKLCVTIAESGGDQSAEWYNRAAKYYKNEGSRVTAQEYIFKIAEIHTKKGEFQPARDIYDKAGREALDDRLSRGAARKLFFNALLCQVALLSATNIDESIALLKEKFEEYQMLDLQFNEQTREHMLIDGIIHAVEEGDPEAYEAAVDDFDNIIPLEDIKRKMLLRGKLCLKGGDIR